MRKSLSSVDYLLLAICFAPVAGWFSGSDAQSATQALVWDGDGNLIQTLTDPGNVAPVISAQPLDQLGKAGGSASLSVIAAGSAPLSYEWRRNGLPGSLAANPSSTTATLVLENLAAVDFASYTVVVANPVSPVESGPAQVKQDNNQDGLPDDWQTAYFGAPTHPDAAPGADPDQDGITNRQEEEDGTIPTNAASRFFRLVVTSGSVDLQPRADRYAPGTAVVLTPLARGGQEFTGWTGDVSGMDSPLQLTMTQDFTLAAGYGTFPLSRPALNPSFTTTAGSGIRALLRQPDGKILAAGKFDAIGIAAHSGIARFAADGAPDAEFTPMIQGTVYCVALQQDGRILVGGAFSKVNGVVRQNLARLNTNGTIDSSFDAGSTFGPNEVRQIQPRASDGKIMAATSFSLRRLTSTGTPDSGFAPGVFSGSISSFVWQPSGKVVVGGQLTQIGTTSVARIARLTDSGAVDGTFSASATGSISTLLERPDGGIYAGFSFGSLNTTATQGLALMTAEGVLDPAFQPGPGVTVQINSTNSLFLQGDGKLLVAGATLAPSGLTNLARFQGSGALDPGFAAVDSANSSSSVVAMNSGDILLGGFFTGINGSERLGLARFSGANGSLDPDSTFGASAAKGANVVAILPDGGTVVGGDFNVVNGVICERLAKLRPDGTLDAAFNHGEGSGPDAEVKAIAARPDGKILIGGSFTGIGGQAAAYLARLSGTGELDNAFAPALNSNVDVITLEKDGDLLLAGGFTQAGTAGRNGLARLFPDGTLDPGFAPSLASSNLVKAIIVQPDDKILVGGTFTQFNGATEVNGKPVTGLVRLEENGAIDYGFTPATLNAADVHAMVVQPDGRVLVAGNFFQVDGFFNTSRLARLRANGEIDLSFSVGGNTLGSTAWAGLALQPDGEVFMGGGFESVPAGAFDYLARFGVKGTRDATFLAGAPPDGPVNSLQLQVSGALVAVGTFKTVGNAPRLGFARLVESGAITTGVVSLSFDPGGGTPVLTLQLAPVSSNGPVTSVAFESSTDGANFVSLGNGLPAGNGTWTLSTTAFPAGGWFRAVVTDLRAAQSTSEAVGPLGLAPVFNLPSRLYGVAFDPYSYNVTVAGAVTDITAVGLPGWAEIDPATGFNAGVFQIRGTPPVPQVFYPTFTATNGQGSSTASTELIITGNYDYWFETNFSAAEKADPLRSGPLGDAIGDGIANLIKYAFGYSAHISPLAQGLPAEGMVYEGGEAYLCLTFRYDLTATDVTLLPQVSDDLGNWNSGPAFTTEVSRTDNGDGSETVVVRDNVPVSAPGLRFMKLEATLLSPP